MKTESNDFKYYEVGQSFKEGNVTLWVVESRNCRGCFYRGQCIASSPLCGHSVRKDNKSVKFLKFNKSCITVESILRLVKSLTITKLLSRLLNETKQYGVLTVTIKTA